MRLADDNDLIQALAAQRTDQAFRYAILPWRSRNDRSVANSHRPQPALEDLSVGRVIIAYQIGWH
jgi:hypothetical protein